MKRRFLWNIAALLLMSYGANRGMNNTAINVENNSTSTVLIITPIFTQVGTKAFSRLITYQEVRAENRKQRREYGERTLFQQKVQESKIQCISKEIEIDCFHVDSTSVMQRFMYKWIVWTSLRYTTHAILMSILRDVSSYVDRLDNNAELTLLLESNPFFDYLIGSFVDRYIDDNGSYNFLTGSMVDAMLFPTDKMFPELNSFLNLYVTNKIKEKYKAQNQAKNLYTVEDLLTKKHRNRSLIKKYREIHRTHIDFEWKVCLKDCNSSADGNYMHCIDMAGKSVLISLEEGREVRAVPKGTVWRAMGRGLHEGRFALLEKYFVKIVPSGMLSDSLMIYSTPTYASRLCQTALGNSIGNSQELKALIASKLVSQLTGFVKENVERLAYIEIEKNRVHKYYSKMELK